MINELYIFVEGTTDSLFIKKVFGKILSEFYTNYTIFEYACKEKKKINQYIATIKSKPNWDYIFMADQDGNINQKSKKISIYSNLEIEKVFISIYEIESWIIAGISDKLSKKHKIINYPDTSNITKEVFNTIIPKKMNRLEFISHILDNYDLEKAVNTNNSLDIFYKYLSNKNAS